MIATTLWVRAFALTLLVEGAIAVPLLRSVEPSRVRRLLAVLLVNLATHPLVWFYVPHLGWAWSNAVRVAEAWAFGFEIVAYRTVFWHASWRRCAAVSVSANLASYLVGLAAVPLGLFR